MDGGRGGRYDAMMAADIARAEREAKAPKVSDLNKTLAFFRDLGHKDLKVVQEEHYRSLKVGHTRYSDDNINNINNIGDGYPGLYMEFKFSLTSGDLITMGVWE